MKSEQTLRESEELFRNMADTAPVMVWVSGSDKLCTFCNKAWLTFTGRAMEEVLGDGWADDVHPDDLDHCMETYYSAFDARRAFQMEYRLRRADREYRWVMDKGSPRFTPEGAFVGYIGSCLDITDLKRSQEQLLVTQKLESLGILAAGIAHDFNNMLGCIVAETDLVYTDLPADSPIRSHLDRIAAVATRGSEVVNLMMDYVGGRGDGDALESINLSLLIEEMLEFLNVSISKKALMEFCLAKDLQAVRANGTQLQRVVMNLIRNASDALGDNTGVIRAATSIVSIGPISRANYDPEVCEGTYVLLEISDTGRGMTKQELSKAFDPFYTTKLAGRGLGLSAVQGIVRSYGGFIKVTTAPGKGSTFQVFLPSAAGLPERKQRRSTTAASQGYSPRRRTVLLVEDEETLRLAVSQGLEKNGFTVMSADNGRAALDLFRRHAEDIDIIVLDVTLPSMSGSEVFKAVRRTRPSVKIILTSAYHAESANADFAFGPGEAYIYIRKPYRIAELISKMTDALSEIRSAVCQSS